MQYYFELFELDDYTQQHLYGFVEDLQLPIDIVSFLDEGCDISFQGYNNRICLILRDHRERGQRHPFNAAQAVPQLLHETYRRQQYVGNRLLNLRYELLVLLGGAILVEEKVKDLPDEIRDVLHIQLIGQIVG